MAKVTKVHAKTEKVEKVLEDEKFTLELTPAEAAGLRTLLYCGTHVDTLRDLDLDDITGALARAGVVDLHKNFTRSSHRFEIGKMVRWY